VGDNIRVQNINTTVLLFRTQLSVPCLREFGRIMIKKILALGLELRAFTLSHSTSPIFMKDFEIRFHELFTYLCILSN
jgi:hypothetical protein